MKKNKNLIIDYMKKEICKEKNWKKREKKKEDIFILQEYMENKIEIISKPNTKYFTKEIESFYGIKFDKNNKEKNSILMIGDNINTDIQFAHNLNIYSCLVLSGVTKYENLHKLNKKECDKINYIIPDISYLLNN